VHIVRLQHCLAASSACLTLLVLCQQSPITCVRASALLMNISSEGCSCHAHTPACTLAAHG
jgi:hypothetical protein